jgi:hypothetical protein
LAFSRMMGPLYGKGVFWWLWGMCVIAHSPSTAEAASNVENRNQNHMESFLVNQEKLLQVQVNIEVLIPKDLFVHPLDGGNAPSMDDWIEERQFILSIDELIRPDNDDDQILPQLSLEQTLHIYEFQCPTPQPGVVISGDPAVPHVVFNCTASRPILIPILAPESLTPRQALLQQSSSSLTLMVALWEEHPRRHCWARRLVHLHPYAAVTRVALRAEMVASPRVANPTTKTLRVHPSWSFRGLFVYTIVAMLPCFVCCCSGNKKPSPGKNEWSDHESADGMDPIDHDDANENQWEHELDEETVRHANREDDDDASVNMYHALAPRPAPEASSSEDEDDLSPPSVARCTNLQDPPSPLLLEQLRLPNGAPYFDSLATATEALCLHSRSHRSSPTPGDATHASPTERSVFSHPVAGPPSDVPTLRRDARPQRPIETFAVEIPEPDHSSEAQELKNTINLDDSRSTPVDVSLPPVLIQNKVTLSTHMKKRKNSPLPEHPWPEEKPIPTVLNFDSRIHDLVTLEPPAFKRNRSEFAHFPERQRHPKSTSPRLPFQSPLRTDHCHASTMPNETTEETANMLVPKQTAVDDASANVANVPGNDVATATHCSTAYPKRARIGTPPPELTKATRSSKKQRTSPDFSYVSTLPPDSLCSDDDSECMPVIPDSPELTDGAMMPSGTEEASSCVVVRSPLVVSSSDSSSRPLDYRSDLQEPKMRTDSVTVVTASQKTHRQGPTNRRSTRSEKKPGAFVFDLPAQLQMPVHTTKRASNSFLDAIPDIPISLSLLAAAEAAKDTGVWTYAEEKDGKASAGPMPSKPRDQMKQRRSLPKSIRSVRKKGRSK